MEFLFRRCLSIDNNLIMKEKKIIEILSKGGLSLTVLVLLFISCKNNSSNKYQYKYGDIKDAVTQNIANDTILRVDSIERIKVDCRYEYTNVGSLLHDIELIPLESNANSLIGEVNKIVIQDSFIYLLDVHKAKSLLVFNVKNGKFVRQIGRYGKSNSEYIEPTDFAIAGNNVVILDNLSKKLLVFDAIGNIKKVTRLQYALQAIGSTEVDSVFIGVAGDNRHIETIHKYRILKFNTSGNILAKFLKMDYAINFNELNSLKFGPNYFWYHAPFANEIIFGDSSMTEVKYKFQFSRKAIPDDFVKQCDGSYEKFIEKYRRYYSYLQNVSCYTDRYLIAQYANEGRNGCLLIYDMIENRIMFNGVPTFEPQEGTIEDFIGMRMSGVNPLFAREDDQVYGILPVEYLTMLNSSEKIKAAYPIDSMLENNNPIMYRCKIRGK